MGGWFAPGVKPAGAERVNLMEMLGFMGCELNLRVCHSRVVMIGMLEDSSGLGVFEPEKLYFTLYACEGC